MKSYHQKFISNHPYESVPMAEISGFPVRPGIYDLNGATPLQNGVNFTIHTCGGTSCELLLFHRAQEEPFAVIPFPDAYKIGDVYSMIVYGLNIEEFEYAYRVERASLRQKQYPSGSLCKSCRRTAYVGNPLGSQLSCTSCPRPF